MKQPLIPRQLHSVLTMSIKKLKGGAPFSDLIAVLSILTSKMTNSLWYPKMNVKTQYFNHEQMMKIFFHDL